MYNIVYILKIIVPYKFSLQEQAKLPDSNGRNETEEEITAIGDKVSKKVNFEIFIFHTNPNAKLS